MSLLLPNSPWKEFLSFHLKDKINSWFCNITSLIDQTVKIQKKMLSRVNRARFHSCLQDPTFLLEAAQFHNVLILQQVCINHILNTELSYLQVIIINTNQTFANNCSTLEQPLKDDIQGEFFFTGMSIKWQKQYWWSRKGVKRSELFKITCCSKLAQNQMF